ncbi:MAG: GNAT family N-acetyltransferase [Planctomycetota bacterium]
MSDPDAVWKALADPTRRALLDLLAAGAQTTGDLCQHFADHRRGGLGRTGVMKHLDVLQSTELVVARRQGRVRWNFLNPVPIQRVCERWVSDHVRGLSTSLNRLKALAEDPADAAELPVGPVVDTQPAAMLQADSLDGDTIELRAVAPQRDGAELYAGSHGSKRREAIWTYMGYGPFSDELAMTRWLNQCAASTDPRFFTVRDRHRGHAVGMAAYLAIEPRQRRVEIGHIWYTPDAHRTATNTEAAYLLLREAFARGYRRVEWKCDALNRRSRVAALRLGFAFEGVFRHHLIVKGRSRDTAWFSMLEADWRQAQPAFETWLQWSGDDRPSLASLRAG